MQSIVLDVATKKGAFATMNKVVFPAFFIGPTIAAPRVAVYFLNFPPTVAFDE